MRKIKFRAWDVGLKEMLPIDFHNITDHDHQLLGEYHDEGYLMQFTGLKDKNGEEIYEGDIVETGGVRGGIVGKVVYEDNGFFIEYKLGYSDFQWDTLEVIGNIYQNPELLTTN